MNARTTVAALAAFAALFTAPRAGLAAEAYTVDASHMSIVFSVSHVGLSYTYGFFREATGSYVLDKANPANCRFQLAIKTASLDTNHAKRDEHLRSPDFFNVQQFPTITFESTKCEQANTQDGSVVYQVTGDLTIHGIKRQVTLPLRMLGEGKGPYGDQRTGFLCQTELKRTDFGMNNLLEDNLVGDAVGITISFEGVVQEPAAGGPAR